MLSGSQENSTYSLRFPDFVLSFSIGPSLSNSENGNNISPIAFSPTKISEKCESLISDAKLKERPCFFCLEQLNKLRI